MRVIHVSVPDDVHARIEAEAVASGRSLSSTARLLIVLGLTATTTSESDNEWAEGHL